LFALRYSCSMGSSSPCKSKLSKLMANLPLVDLATNMSFPIINEHRGTNEFRQNWRPARPNLLAIHCSSVLLYSRQESINKSSLPERPWAAHNSTYIEFNTQQAMQDVDWHRCTKSCWQLSACRIRLWLCYLKERVTAPNPESRGDVKCWALVPWSQSTTYRINLDKHRNRNNPH
jgi:hypothetical protein